MTGCAVFTWGGVCVVKGIDLDGDDDDDGNDENEEGNGIDLGATLLVGSFVGCVFNLCLFVWIDLRRLLTLLFSSFQFSFSFSFSFFVLLLLHPF